MEKKQILVLNGPNLNLLGKREPGIYGNDSMESGFAALQERFPEVKLDYYQSNVEGELINKLHEVGFSYDGIAFNAGAYTHTSVAILDALKAVAIPTVEVHISDINSREEFRKFSYVSLVAKKTIAGLGLDGYRVAIEELTAILEA